MDKNKNFIPCLFFPPFPAQRSHLGPSLFSPSILPRYYYLYCTTVHLLTVWYASIHPSIASKWHAPKETTTNPSARVRLKWLHDYWHLLLPRGMHAVLYTLAPYSIYNLFSLFSPVPLYSHTLPSLPAKSGSRLISQPFFLPPPQPNCFRSSFDSDLRAFFLLLLFFFYFLSPCFFHPVS